MAYENNDKRMESVYSKRIRAGKRRTYFFDVRTTKGNDYYLTITESRKRFNDDGYDRHKIFLYKEDFNKFIKALDEAVTYVKTDLMPDFDFDAFNHDNEFEQEGDEETDIAPVTEQKIIQIPSKTVVLTRSEPTPQTEDNLGTDVVDKW
ncbi:MAG: PUR family DNA/RNA-binding protein [Chitinophagaceae bacterium]|nr:PUR family DNA/RNA-binding protein [Chitinophagaceae bacterium]